MDKPQQKEFKKTFQNILYPNLHSEYCYNNSNVDKKVFREVKSTMLKSIWR